MADQNQNQRQGKQGYYRTPKLDPKNLTLTQGPISKTLTDFIVKIRAELTQGSRRIDGVLLVREGVDTIDSLPTINGICFYPITEPFSSAGRPRTFIFSLDGAEKVEREITINFPLRATKEKNKKDPDELQVSRHRNLAGINALFIRVVDALGIGIKTTVQVCAEGWLHDVSLDKHGTATWTFPRQLTPRETIDADVCVSGIQEKAKVVLRGPRLVDPNRHPAWTWRWWYGTNNGRGVALLIAMVVICALALIIGPGDPLISFGHTQLSQQEIFYNQGTKYYKAVAEQAPGILHNTGNDVCKFVWFFLAPLLTIFAPLYFFFSLREEITEGIVEGLELLVDRPYVTSKDPLAERIMAWAGTRSVARSRPPQQITPPAQQPETLTQAEAQPTLKQQVSFWKLFRSDLLSDLLVEVVPQMLKHFFR